MGFASRVADVGNENTLGEAVASAIAEAGVPLLGAPVMLYDIPDSSQPGAGPIGATSDQLGYNDWLGTSYTKTTIATEYIDTGIGLEGNPATTCQKIFLQNWITSTTVGTHKGNINPDLANLINLGMQVILCMKPYINPTGVYGQPGDPSVSDYASMQATLGYLTAYGATDIICVLEQEINGNGDMTESSQATPYAAYYGPGIRTLGYPLYLVLATNHTLDGNYEEWFDAFTAGCQIDGLGADYYGNTYVGEKSNPPYLLDVAFGAATHSFEWLADNYSHGPIPLALTEWGNAQASTAAGITETQWVSFWQYIQNLFLTRLNNGKTNGPICWYSGTNPPPEFDLLPNYIGYADPNAIVDGLNAIYETLSKASSSITIAAGQTVTLVPITPSANAGFAIIQGLSYELVIGSQASSGSTVPFDSVTLDFYEEDDPDAVSFKPVTWDIPSGQSGSTGPTSISGSGPLRGQFMSVTVKNNDTVPHSINMVLLATSRTSDVHDWQWDAASSPPIPGFTLPPLSGNTGRNTLAIIPSGTSVPANGNVTYLCSLFSGYAYVKGSTGATTTGVMQIQMHPAFTSLFESSIFESEIVNSLADPNVGDFAGTVILPRSPCTITIANTDTSSHSGNAIVIAKENG